MGTSARRGSFLRTGFLLLVVLWGTADPVPAEPENGPRVVLRTAKQVLPGPAGSDSRAPGRLIWTRADGESSTGQELIQDVEEIPSELPMGVDRGTWALHVDIPGFWAPSQVVEITESSRVVLEVFPTGSLVGSIEVPRGEDAPEVITARFESSDPESSIVPQTQLECPIRQKKWRCELPAAGALDVRLRARGFISHHRWGLRVPTRGTLDLGKLALRRGASLVGWMMPGVEVDRELDLSQDGEVTLRPMAAGKSREPDRMERLHLETKPNRRGFFHFQGVPPGSYAVSATLPGLAAAELFPVQVMENAETELRDPLELFPPLQLEVEIRPSLDLFGNPWSVTLLQLTDVPGSGEHVGEGKTSEQGMYVQKGLSAGTYWMLIDDSRGSRMTVEEIQMLEVDTRIELELPVVWIEGEVFLDDEPIQADLWFGGRFGPHRSQLSSDDEGRFVGYLPREGEWKVLVDSEELEVRRTIHTEIAERSDGKPTWVELRLPNTLVSGKVVDAEGNAVREALVQLRERGIDATADVMSDEEGRFAFRGVAEGLVRLNAERRSSSSVEHLFEVSEETDHTDLKLVLREARKVVGTVTGPAGPVPGASVWLNGYDLAGRPQATDSRSEGTTDVNGRFELLVSAGTPRIQPVVFPPGFTLRVLPQMEVPEPENPLAIQVEQQSAGTLILELSEPVEWGDNVWGLKPAVLLDGAPVSFWVLEHWRRAQGGARLTDDDLLLRLPAMPPGTYRACWMPPAETTASAFASGCPEGYLAPNGELRLSVPSR